MLFPFQLNNNYADESETNTEQGLAQKNDGSGDSTNSNCAHNMIDISTNVIECGDDGAILPVMLPPDFTYALDRCNLSSE
jgi:hypothetical protein